MSSSPFVKNLRTPDDIFEADGLLERTIDLAFDDRGAHELKGIDGARTLFAARAR